MTMLLNCQVGMLLLLLLSLLGTTFPYVIHFVYKGLHNASLCFVEVRFLKEQFCEKLFKFYRHKNKLNKTHGPVKIHR